LAWGGRFDHQVKVIAHQTICVHLPFGLAASLIQRSQKATPVLVILEDVLALISAIQEVVNGPRILDAQLARHSPDLPASINCVNSED
jgi:hypothetical protein